jgi:hypothetical protein
MKLEAATASLVGLLAYRQAATMMSVGSGVLVTLVAIQGIRRGTEFFCRLADADYITLVRNANEKIEILPPACVMAAAVSMCVLKFFGAISTVPGPLLIAGFITLITLVEKPLHINRIIKVNAHLASIEAERLQNEEVAAANAKFKSACITLKVDENKKETPDFLVKVQTQYETLRLELETALNSLSHPASIKAVEEMLKELDTARQTLMDHAGVGAS